ncbi:hypothetical protein FXO38_01763 [Capsicum annuum]|uniref:Uncharacterized protein n=1 Tax=Capsicum annuum TaxID=4072 RepID=A0A2G2YWU7_CAPAN|nr:hypothetical protein FXO37_11357 [Capsicum annuum]KAF3681342.1 hypothetical protein FXO38_01763 [Capsicum annuum]PHT74183.1 hypothetical protein T459_21460 [Capsicum annuum]
MIDHTYDGHLKNKMIFLTGGYDGVSWLSTLDSYLPSFDVLNLLKPMNSVHAYALVSKLSEEFYVFGGGIGNLCYDTIESYNSTNDKWTISPCLKEKRGSLAGANLKDKIFAIVCGNGIEFFSDGEYLHSTNKFVTTLAKASEDEELAVLLKQDAMLASKT